MELQVPGGAAEDSSLCSGRRFELTVGGGFGISNRVDFASDSGGSCKTCNPQSGQSTICSCCKDTAESCP